jgi:hypothetical protein
MSRTYKDRPQWVRARKDTGYPLEPRHNHEWFRVDCDIDNVPQSRDEWDNQICNLVPHDHPWFSGDSRSHPTSEECHTEWHNPERMIARDELRKAASSYNRGDDLNDYDYVNRQHRHGVSWWW